MQGILKRMASILSTVVLTLIIGTTALLVLPRLFGLTPYTVLSGSMKPTYHVGSLIYVRRVDPQSLREKDPVTYRISGSTVVTHRIVDVIYDEDGSGRILHFRTKGDANRDWDGGKLLPQSVIGKPVFSIPLLGFLAFVIQNPPGSFIVIALCVFLLILMFIPELFKPPRAASAALAEKEAELSAAKKAARASRAELTKQGDTPNGAQHKSSPLNEKEK